MCNNVAVAQLIERLTGVPKDPVLNRLGRMFFHINSFKRGNETNGKEQGLVKQQLE